MKKNIEQTSEEERVVFYNDSAEPTVPSQVTAKTKLEALNLNWRERDLPEKIRTKHVHRLHPYLGKYIPQLVEIFLRKYFKPGQTVLDPFSGSGTTLVQANELDIHSVGYDISAFNIILARAKTKTYDLKKVRGEILDILERVHQATQNEAQQLSLWTDGKKGRRKEKVNEYLHAWYAPAALHELITYRDLISEYDDQDLLKVILSRAARSARLTTHFDLDFPKKPQIEPYWCYKHSRTCTPTQDAYQFIKRYSLDTIKRIEEFAQQRTNATVQIFHDDSRKAQIPMIDGVMTSPPYVGLIDYHDQHRYAYELLGLEDRSGFEIGPASGGSSQKAKRKYQEGIAEVFTNALKSMTKGGRLIVVAGDRHDLYGEIATMCDVNVEAVLQRHVNRRTGRRSGEFFESVFIWRKK
ncbi:MAG TPA: DNA methyltransferase [Anaerolineales bacterium]|nr:DNA methyltransferase [Anaerolineales bacterium]